jgi:hypothetical protein
MVDWSPGKRRDGKCRCTVVAMKLDEINNGGVRPQPRHVSISGLSVIGGRPWPCTAVIL